MLRLTIAFTAQIPKVCVQIKVQTKCRSIAFLDTSAMAFYPVPHSSRRLFNTFSKGADPGSTVFAYGNMIRCDHTLAD